MIQLFLALALVSIFLDTYAQPGKPSHKLRSSSSAPLTDTTPGPTLGSGRASRSEYFEALKKIKEYSEILEKLKDAAPELLSGATLKGAMSYAYKKPVLELADKINQQSLYTFGDKRSRSLARGTKQLVALKSVRIGGLAGSIVLGLKGLFDLCFSDAHPPTPQMCYSERASRRY